MNLAERRCVLCDSPAVALFSATFLCLETGERVPAERLPVCETHALNLVSEIGDMLDRQQAFYTTDGMTRQ